MSTPIAMPLRRRSRTAQPPACRIDDADRRTRVYRRYRSIREALTSDAGGDVSEAKRQLIERSSFLASRLEAMEVQALAGAEIDAVAYGSLADRLRRLLVAVGLQRTPRPVETLAQYTARVYGAGKPSADEARS